MGRPTPVDNAPSDVERVEPDDAAMRRRYRRLSYFLAASEPDSVAAGISLSIRRERDRLDETGAGIGERLAVLERWLEARGLLADASAHADRVGAAARSCRTARC